MLRVLHFSDVHVQEPVWRLGLGELLNKRLLGAANLTFHRASRFAAAPHKLAQLDAFRREQNVDLVVCTGDYTALGTEREFHRARSSVQPLTEAPLGFVTVPGNHDVYVTDSVRDQRFERHFGDFLRSDLGRTGQTETWPLVRFFGTDLVVIALHTARPNVSPIDSSGAVVPRQLQVLAELLTDPDVRSRQVLLLTHYAPLAQDGRPDSPRHGLAGADSLLEVASTHPRLALLHGHIHHRYHHPAAAARPWLFCAGSATHRGREGLWMFEFTQGAARAIPGRYEATGYVLQPELAVDLVPHAN